jgi:hypothetical protein
MSDDPEHDAKLEGVALPVKVFDNAESGNFLDVLTPLNQESPEKILAGLIVGDKHIALKTELKNPLAVARLQAIAAWLHKEGLEDAAATLKGFIDDYMKDMVSFNRAGRKEIIEGIKARMEAEKENRNKWTGRSEQPGE